MPIFMSAKMWDGRSPQPLGDTSTNDGRRITRLRIMNSTSSNNRVVIKDTRIIGSLSNPSIDAGLLYTYNNQMKTNGQVRSLSSYFATHSSYV